MAERAQSTESDNNVKGLIKLFELQCKIYDYNISKKNFSKDLIFS